MRAPAAATMPFSTTPSPCLGASVTRRALCQRRSTRIVTFRLRLGAGGWNVSYVRCKALAIGSQDMLWFQSALTHDGWARDVRIAVENGVITRIETSARAAAG